MKKEFIRLSLLLIVGLFFTPAAMADIADLNEELIEADAIGADSEAAIIESEQLKEQLIEEQKEAERLKARLDREKAAAKRRRTRAEKEIAETEKKIADSRARADKMNKELVKLDAEQEKMRKKTEKTQAELDLVKGEEQKVAESKRQADKLLNQMIREHREMKANAKRTATRVSSIRADVKRSRVKVGRTYRNMKKDSNEYQKMIEIYRKSLAKAENMLNELEMAIQIDQAYDQKLATMGKKLPENYRTVSGLNRTRVAQIKTATCNVRAYPSTKAEILGKVHAGNKIEMKHHSRSWYTIVHGGEKAFLGKTCFN